MSKQIEAMSLYEAAKQALEVLEKLWDIIDDIDTYGDMAKADDKLYRSLVDRRQRQRFETTGISTDGYELSGGAITALRVAIASYSTAISEAESRSIEQAEQEQSSVKQEPVAWLIWLHGPAGLFENKQFAEHEFARRNQEYPDKDRKLRPLIFGDTTPPAQPAPVQEPFMWVCNSLSETEWETSKHKECEHCIPLYTTPPNVATPLAAQREWLGLTDEDKRLFSSWLDDKEDDEVFEAIEAKLREKNHHG